IEKRISMIRLDTYPYYLKTEVREASFQNLTTADGDSHEDLEVSNSHVAKLHESGKAASRGDVRPLKADRARFFPRRLSRVRRVVGDVADFRPVQGDLETRALEGNLDMVPILLLAKIGELLVARVEPKDVSSD